MSTPSTPDLNFGNPLVAREVKDIGGCPFAPIGKGAYPVTLTGHGFYWLRLLPAAEPDARRHGPAGAGEGGHGTIRIPADPEHGGLADGRTRQLPPDRDGRCD